jgi:hypothetical protein
MVRQLDPAPWAPPMPTPAFAVTHCSGEPVVGATAVTGPVASPVITVYPSANITVNSGASVFLDASATDSSGAPIAITWAQSAGPRPQAAPVVVRGQPNAITFTAPFTAGQMVFAVTATNAKTGLSSTATVTVSVTTQAADVVTITTANWSSVFQNRGALSVTATTSAPLDANGMPPPGLQLYVQATAMVYLSKVDANGWLNFQLSEVQMSATPLPMFFAPTGNPANCPIGVERCWQFVTRGALAADQSNGNLFVPPDAVTVTSSYGGAAVGTQYDGTIQVR